MESKKEYAKAMVGICERHPVWTDAIEAYVTDLEAEIRDLAMQLHDKDTDLNILTAERDELKQHIAALTSDLEVISSMRDDLLAQANRRRTEMAELKDKYTALRSLVEGSLISTDFETGLNHYCVPITALEQKV